MLPAQETPPQNYQHYSVTTKHSQIEGNFVLSYGLEQISLDGCGKTIKITFEDITDEKSLITGLLNHIIDEDIPSESLKYIIEDYVTEYYTVK